MTDPSDHGQMVTDCEVRESRLTDWERGLIASCRECLDKGWRLTPKQADALEEIWERVTGQDITRGGAIRR